MINSDSHSAEDLVEVWKKLTDTCKVSPRVFLSLFYYPLSFVYRAVLVDEGSLGLKLDFHGLRLGSNNKLSKLCAQKPSSVMEKEKAIMWGSL